MLVPKQRIFDFFLCLLQFSKMVGRPDCISLAPGVIFLVRLALNVGCVPISFPQRSLLKNISGKSDTVL